MIMGSGLLSALLAVFSRDLGWLLPFAAVLWAVVALTLVGMTVAFVVRCLLSHEAFRATFENFAVIPLWGAVSMAMLSIGWATMTIVPLLNPDLRPVAVHVDFVLWALGTLLGLLTAFGFTAAIVVRHPGRPLPVWGLSLVPPIVSATTGSALVPYIPHADLQLTLIIMTVACFFTSIVLGFVIFAVAFHHHIRVENIPVEASMSAWIPLGVVGQSMAAAQSIAAQSERFVLPFAVPTIHTLADLYGYLMLAATVPVIANAKWITLRGFRAGISFNPGWWALVFPVGTVTLGTRLLGQSSGHAWISAVSWVLLCLMSVHWLFCAVSMAIAWAHRSPRTTPTPQAA
jgi:tellurite resistance protein TehA-like permease